MIVQLDAEEITIWFLAFHKKCLSPFWQRVIPGKYKHVNAFGWSERAQVWVYYDCGFHGTRVIVCPPGPKADQQLERWMAGADVLRVSQKLKRERPIYAFRFFHLCTTAMRHLCDISGGALLPDGLWVDCLRENAKVIFHDDSRSSGTNPRPDIGCPDQRGQCG